MLFRVEASSPVPIYAQIVGQVRAAVAAGELAEGDPLPSVRQLAGDLRVNPNTVAQAYRELEREGITYVQRGQGTFIAAMETGRREAEREELARTLIDRMLEDAFRLGLSPADVREALDRSLARAAGDETLAAAPAAALPNRGQEP
jgi:GntR family transcriptional regulator